MRAASSDPGDGSRNWPSPESGRDGKAAEFGFDRIAGFGIAVGCVPARDAEQPRVRPRISSRAACSSWLARRRQGLPPRSARRQGFGLAGGVCADRLHLDLPPGPARMASTRREGGERRLGGRSDAGAGPCSRRSVFGRPPRRCGAMPACRGAGGRNHTPGTISLHGMLVAEAESRCPGSTAPGCGAGGPESAGNGGARCGCCRVAVGKRHLIPASPPVRWPRTRPLRP